LYLFAGDIQMTVRRKTAPLVGKVLVAYYDPEITRILEVNLVHANLEVALAHSGTEVLEIIRNDKSDIVILDQELLDMENSHIYRRIKELVGDAHIVLIGNKSKKKRTAVEPDDFTVSYLSKPFDPREVLALVRGYLMRKELTANSAPLAAGKSATAGAVLKKWRSYMQEVDSLQVAMEISRKHAREALRNIQRIVASLVKMASPELKESSERLSGDIQEMAVLCNRSLYLAANFNSQLEAVQDQLSQQELEQIAMSEAVLNICRHISSLLQVKLLFELESARRVVSYSLAIAKELGMPDAERQALHHAALLKDVALGFSRPDIIEQLTSTSREIATSVKERLNSVWKALDAIPFLAPACDLLLYRYERYDGTGGPFGQKGNKIPLGSRILAVADAFNSLTSGRSPRGKLAPELAVRQIVEQSGLAFDPHVVSALLMLWKKNELEFVAGENKGEASRGVTS
jgi:response regulator RpfG family c-di-GMP phosphodiesterase